MGIVRACPSFPGERRGRRRARCVVLILIVSALSKGLFSLHGAALKAKSVSSPAGVPCRVEGGGVGEHGPVYITYCPSTRVEISALENAIIYQCHFCLRGQVPL